MTKIAILYPSDPIGYIPSGIDSFIRGILKWAPPDLDYTLFGASSDAASRPIGRPAAVPGLYRVSQFLPIVRVDASARRSIMPLTVRYIWALRRYRSQLHQEGFSLLDFHRPEPLVLFGSDLRPKHLVLHQDMSVIRDRSSDIKWRHAPTVYEWAEERLLRGVGHVYCVRETAVERYRERYPDSKCAFDFIPTWVDTDVFFYEADPELRRMARDTIRAELGASKSLKLLTFVGRLDHQKDPLLLIDSVALLRRSVRDVHLVIIGDGVLRTQVEKRIRESGLAGDVTLLGAQPPMRIAQLLRASDLFVLSSAYEGMPIVVLEALASGLPVVSTDVGEIRRVVHEGVNGAVSTAQTSEALAQALHKALSQLDSLKGQPCTEAVGPYRPEAVLGRLYDMHRFMTRDARIGRL